MSYPDKTKLNDAEAVKRLNELGFTPDEPYPGLTLLPWNATCDTCGRPSKVRLSTSRPCRFCSRGTPNNDQATAELHDAGFDTDEAFPDALHKPWHVTCRTCHRPATVTLAAIRKGRSCQACVRGAVEPDQAAAEARTAGYEPLMAYPGSLRAPWAVTCRRHGHKRRTTLHNIRHRIALDCPDCTKHDEAEHAVDTMRDAHYEPDTDYPGSPQARWSVHCTDCDAPSRPSLYEVRNGRRCRCTHTDTLTPGKAAAQLRKAGYTSDQDYPGAMNKPWPAECIHCGKHAKPTVNDILKGRRCPCTKKKPTALSRKKTRQARKTTK